MKKKTLALLLFCVFLVSFLSGQSVDRKKIRLDDSAIVHVAPGATIFHLSKCKNLGSRRMGMTVNVALEKGYSPCPLCIPIKVTKIYQLNYDILLSGVERPASAEKRYGEIKIDKIEKEGVQQYAFEDEMITSFWIVNPAGISFILNNKTAHSIKIIWDEGAFLDENGGSHRIVHSGIKYTDKEKPQAPSVVVRKGILKDTIYPSDYISWSGSEWEERAIFKHSQKGGIPEPFFLQAKENIGKTVQVLLPLQIEGVVNEYIFIFKINNVELVKTEY